MPNHVSVWGSAQSIFQHSAISVSDLVDSIRPIPRRSSHHHHEQPAAVHPDLLFPQLLPLSSLCETAHVFSNHEMPPRIRTIEGSCWSCKERRVICDLKTPACEKCQKIGRECSYGKVRLRWTDCVASRGRLAGKKIPAIFQPPLLLRQSSDGHMLYFEKELLPRFNLSNTVPHLNLDFLSKDPILMQSVIAVSNAHYAYRSANVQALCLETIQGRNEAIKLFREHLMVEHSDEINQSLFIANVLLCILDGIIEPSKDSSATHYHLVGGRAILKQWAGMRDVFTAKQELPILMFSIFATMDLTHSLLIGDQPFFESSAWAEFGDSEPWWGNVKANDPFLETMAIISQLASYGFEVRNCRNTVQIGTLLSIQMALEQTGPDTYIKQEDGTPEKPGWAAFCSVYRYAASVYLYRALSGLEVNHELVQKTVKSCMDLLAGTDLTESLHHCILFPLLIVSANCLLPAQRATTLKSLFTTSRYLSFESLRSLQEFLEKRWAKLDSDPKTLEWSWWESFDEIANVSCLF